jgi:Uma2 family endonuclease
MDIDEFMAFIAPRPKEERWHLIEGIAVVMAPPSVAHQRIALNLCELLDRALATARHDLFAYHEIAIRLPGVKNSSRSRMSWLLRPRLATTCSWKIFAWWPKSCRLRIRAPKWS